MDKDKGREPEKEAGPGDPQAAAEAASLIGAKPEMELGFAGSNVWGGHVNEEFIPQLVGVLGRRTFREMRENDSMIGAIFYALETLGTSVDWRVEEAEDGAEEDVQFLEEVFLQEDMDSSWSHFIMDTFTSLIYGWSYFEVTYKLRATDMTRKLKETTSYFNIGGTGNDGGVGVLRKPVSKFNDGKIGIQAIALRPQDTLWQWHVSEKGKVLGMTQINPINGEQVTIKINKALHLVTRPNKGSPEGFSLLRNSYRDWFAKRRIENIEVDGIDRDLTGLPIASIPGDILEKAARGDERAQKTVERYKAVVKDIRTNQTSGIVVPSDMWLDTELHPSNARKVSIELLASPGQRTIDIDAAIRRRDRGIARALLADFMTLGGEAHGNFALSRNLSSLFVTALTSWLDNVENEVNRQIIPWLWRLNGRDPDKDKPPMLKHGQVVPNDLEQLGSFLREATTAGLITLPDPKLEDEVRGSGRDAVSATAGGAPEVAGGAGAGGYPD